MAATAKSVRLVSAKILEKVAKRKHFVDSLIEEALSKNEFKANDRALLLELVNGTLRWKGYLDWILAKLFRGEFSTANPLLKAILEISLYQLIYLEKVPDYAAVSEGVKIARRTGGESWARLVNGVLRTYNREKERFASIRARAGEEAEDLAVSYSHPIWLLKRWLTHYGVENTKGYCDYNNQRPAVSFRVTGGELQREQTFAALEKSVSFLRSSFFYDFITTDEPAKLLQSNLFKEGKLTIQDQSTAISTNLLAPSLDEIVADLCAAPGGKSCYLADLKRSGKINAFDVDSNRISLLNRNILRLGLEERISVKKLDTAKDELPKADKILIDAPCSGLGVLSKRADLRWQRTETDILNIKKVQLKLLRNAAKSLNQGGQIVYSTCTLEPEETFDVVEVFLEEHQDFVINKEAFRELAPFESEPGVYQSLPFKHHMDGSFSVRLKRTSLS